MKSDVALEESYDGRRVIETGPVDGPIVGVQDGQEPPRPEELGRAQDQRLPGRELAPERLIGRHRGIERQLFPKSLQRGGGVLRIAGNDGGIEGADGDPGHQIGMDPPLLERPHHPALEGSKCATAL